MEEAIALVSYCATPRVEGLLVMSLNGVSTSRAAIVCKASMVAEGGVFSPRMALGGGLEEGLRLGVSFSGSLLDGVGVVEVRSGLER